jgi:NTE family protein
LFEADVVIEPQVTHIGWEDFHRAQECILQGELAAQAAIPEIKN